MTLLWRQTFSAIHKKEKLSLGLLDLPITPRWKFRTPWPASRVIKKSDLLAGQQGAPAGS